MDQNVWRNTTPTDYVQSLRQRILKEVRLPVSAGLGNSALMAKLATDAAKPTGFIEVPAGQEQVFLKDRPVQELAGIGKHRRRSLAALGALTFDHVATLPAMLMRQSSGV
jgi:DNA polymerase-4